ncbi:Fc receptor-like protein 5 [Clarias gariepinus]|uniref:Fc receptor-like protein 5 n=1 Tax=Clarias gariepinus TaxID=13013 RepID=UPI00234D5B0F|nr:Fc receptor-like protein 5 [Clarias gariepinus]
MAAINCTTPLSQRLYYRAQVHMLILLLPLPHAQERPRAVLSVSPQSWVTERDSVTLICNVTDSSTNWTFSWYRYFSYRDNDGNIQYSLELLKGSQWSYTISLAAAAEDTGVYSCRGKRGKPAFFTLDNKQQPLWIIGKSPSVSLIINPSRTQHFSGDSLSLSCEDQSNSTGWILERYTQSEGVLDCSRWGSVTGSTCEISSLSTSYTGVYWCESESGENSNPVNITVHDGDVILESPVHPVTEGHPLTLRCLYRNTNPSNLRADFYKDGSVCQKKTTGEMIIHDVSKSDEGFYYCKYPWKTESEKSWVSVRRMISVPPEPDVPGSSKALVSMKPDKHVYKGDKVTLRCDIQGGDTDWSYNWYRNKNKVFSDNTNQEVNMYVKFIDRGKYTCRGERNGSQSSAISDAVTLTVSERPQAVLSVSPQNWLTEGDSVTLSCEVTDSSTNWTFSWYRDVSYRDNISQILYKEELLSDSSRGSRGSYTLSPAALNHTGVYICDAKRDDPSFYMHYKYKQALWINGESPPVSLIINPSRTQHFTGHSLSLSCEDLSNSTAWTVRQYLPQFYGTICSQSGSVTGSTCKISYLSKYDTGVYWCQSESGENSNPVNITVHDGNVILESPVHPVTEGHPLTLRCLYRYTNSLNALADFYKDGSVLQTQSTGEMIIHNVTMSDTGFYHCNHSERGESPKSWVLVRSSGSGSSFRTVGFAVGLSLAFLFIALLILMILLWCCKFQKEKKQKNNQTSKENQHQSGAFDSQSGYTPLQTGEGAAESSDETYSQATEKKKINRKNDVDAEPSSQDVTYAEIEMKQKKKCMRKTEKASLDADTVYSEVKMNAE